jgi:hypothetical protein
LAVGEFPAIDGKTFLHMATKLPNLKNYRKNRGRTETNRAGSRNSDSIRRYPALKTQMRQSDAILQKISKDFSEVREELLTLKQTTAVIPVLQNKLTDL